MKGLLIRLAKDDHRVSCANRMMFHRDGALYSVRFLDSRTPFSAMHVFAYLGFEKMVLELLNHGFKADTEDSTHRTPLWWATYQGHQAVVEMLLLQSLVNVNQRGLSNVITETPLGIATIYDREAMVKTLLNQQNILVNLGNSDGVTPPASASA